MTTDIVALARRHKHIASHYEGCEADHIGCLVNKLADEIERLSAENEMLIVAVTMIERMAAGAIYSQESIHAAAIGVLKQLEGKP